MITKLTNSKILIFFVFFSLIYAKGIDDTDESQILEGILEAMKNLRIPYKSLEDEIDHKIYLKLLKYLVLNDADSFGVLNGFGGLEDAFIMRISKEVTQTVPAKIKIKDLPKYLNPRKIEPLINNALNEFDFGSMLKDIGDAFGITDTIKETMKESSKKDKEREKINQARIKRKQEREKAKLNQNMTNNLNNSDENTNSKKEIKYPKRDLRNNISEGINDDL